MSAEAIALWTETSSDPELIAGVRAGDTAAFGVLYERHVDAARKVAVQYTNAAADVDDVVSESFSRVLRALQQGDGPDMAFRAYLFTIVRRTGLDIINKAIRTKPRDDMSPYESALGYGASSDEPAIVQFEQSMVAGAFTSLPERWRAVLWYTEVEKKSPKEIAPLLGLSANGVAALAYRAREALRQGYLQQHLAGTEDIDCLDANTQLGAYVRGGLSKREHTKVDLHVQECERCAALAAELEDVNRGMRGIIAPLFLGVAGMGALEGGLPIGGVFGTGGAVSGGATATTGSGSAGASGSAVSGGVVVSGASSGSVAATGGLTLAGALSALAPFALPAAAVAGVVALAVGGASYMGLFSGDEVGDEYVGGPAVVSGVEPETEPGEGSDEGPATDSIDAVDSDAPDAADAPGSSDVPASSGGDGSGAVPIDPRPAGPGAGPTEPGPSLPVVIPPRDPDPGPLPPLQPRPGEGTGGTDPEEPAPGTDPDGSEPGQPDPVSPTEPTDPPPPVRTPQVTIDRAPLDFLEISRTASQVPLAISNDGDGDAAPVTAVIDLPDGLEVAAVPAGGSAFAIATVDRIDAYLKAMRDGEVSVGDWTCVVSAAGTSADCELGTLQAGDTATLHLPLAITADALADEALIAFHVSAGDHSTSYTVHTALAPEDGPGTQLPPIYAERSPGLDVRAFGGTVMGCDTSLPVRPGDNISCREAMTDTSTANRSELSNNHWQMIQLNEHGGERNSGQTTVTLPDGVTVTAAYLEWSANRYLHPSNLSDEWTGALDTARLRIGEGDFTTITADEVDSSIIEENRQYYLARADVTDLVAAAGSDVYTVADIAVSEHRREQAVHTYYGGFTLTIVYEDPEIHETSTVALFQGPHWVKGSAPVEIRFFGREGSRVTPTWTAYEGDRGNSGDRLRFGGDSFVPQALMPDGTVTTRNSADAADSWANGSGWANTLGIDANGFSTKTLPSTGVHTIRAETSGDNFMIGVLAVRIELAD